MDNSKQDFSSINNKVKKTSDILYSITIFLLIVLLFWFFFSIVGGYLYLRIIAIFLLIFSIVALLFQIISIKNEASKRKKPLFLRVFFSLSLNVVSILYYASPHFIMSFWGLYPIQNSTLLFCYDSTGGWQGEGDQYAILKTTRNNIKDLTGTMRPFDEKQDMFFGGYHLRFSPDKFKNCMVSEKLGSEYMFEFNKEKVKVHIWTPNM